jgi:hypothetical protein
MQRTGSRKDSSYTSQSLSYEQQQREAWDKQLGRWRGHAYVAYRLADIARQGGCPILAAAHERAGARWQQIEAEHGRYDIEFELNANDTANLRAIAEMIHSAQTKAETVSFELVS